MKIKGLAGLSNLRGTVRDATAPVGAHDALEAAIEANPDDAASYAVYADALAAVNDPRGAFITLHDRGTPEDIARYLDEHRLYLLGLLHERASEYTAEWFMGFIRKLALTPKSTASALEILDFVAMLPACRFVQEIVIEPPKAFDSSAIVDKLVALGKPRTLSHVQIAVRGWSVPDALVKAFPRLATADSGIDRVIDDVRTRTRMNVRLDIAKLPKLVAKTSRGSIDQALVLRALKIELGSKTPVPALAAVRATFTPESLAALGQALLDLWNAAGRPASEDWVTDFANVVGGDRRAELAVDLDEFAEMDHDQALEIISRLAESASASAILTLFTLAEAPTRRAPRRLAAYRWLETIARQRGIPVQRLIDETSPSDVPAGLRACVERAHLLWLEQLMTTGRRVLLALLDKPLRRAAAHGLVLVVHEARVDRREDVAWFDGDTLTSFDGRITLDGDMKVGVLHPAAPGTLDLAKLRALGLSPHIDQLDRAVYTLRADEKQAQTITRFATRLAPLGAIAARLEPLGWEAGGRQEVTGLPTSFTKTFGTAPPIAATAHVSGGCIASVRFDGRVEKLSPIAISELLSELDRGTR